MCENKHNCRFFLATGTNDEEQIILEGYIEFKI